jgi:hypothetical protein
MAQLVHFVQVGRWVVDAIFVRISDGYKYGMNWPRNTILILFTYSSQSIAKPFI